MRNRRRLNGLKERFCLKLRCQESFEPTAQFRIIPSDFFQAIRTSTGIVQIADLDEQLPLAVVAGWRPGHEVV